MVSQEPTGGKGQEYSFASFNSEDVATTVVFREPAPFVAPDGAQVRLSPGAYRVIVTGDGQLELTDLAGQRAVRIVAVRSWHEFELRSPLVLAFPDPQAGHQQIVAVLLSGGLAFLSGADPRSPILGSVPTPVVLDVLMKWLPFVTPENLPVDENLLRRLSTVFGTIDPSSPPTAFALMSHPPNWITTEIVRWDPGTPPLNRPVSEGGSAPGVWPGSGPGVVYLPSPGSVEWHHYTSTTTVTVNSSISMTGRRVRLMVTHFVETVGDYGAYSLVKDTYQQIPSAPGPVTFPGVIVAAGLSPSYPPPQSTWVQLIAEKHKAQPGMGRPVDFELRVQNIKLAERHCRFNSVGPALSCP